LSFKKVAYLISRDIPIIIESPVSEGNINTEIENALCIFDENSFKDYTSVFGCVPIMQEAIHEGKEN
jgi:hypothetical protein